ncbi:type I restriction endonuclease subunit R [Microbacterium esteraromaticum]|uniref:type I restriction endonuclease subunit R n=1 Tax=Microbacterium esteraromaticum TaxID=57043 RepID=UPI001A8C8C79|nr:DEAD/DEAH box helicase family protein [Microbacterium esteraromaticum]MBN8424719.1 type I restriction endonuclease subunit R [Microbacterium esteraromaticum]
MTGISGAHLEVVLENEIAEHLAANSWLYSPNDAGYDRELALFPEDVLGWLEDSQPTEFAKVVRPNDTETQRDAAGREILARLAKSLDLDPLKNGGTIRILHEGFSMVPQQGGAVKFRLAQFRPVTTNNPDTLDAYAKMRVRVMRQVHYSAKNPNKALDLVLFVNGIPVATVELKTDFTQSIGNAVNQYRFDRSPAGEPLFAFAKRSLVHFVVSNSEVRMTTKLAGAETRFLPFNRGHDEGAGNPPNPAGSASSYFWEEILQRDTWLQVLGSFVHLQVEVDVDPDTGKKTRTEKILFPRYHQWRAVNRLVAAARQEGAGRRYLVQHSAGSGKTNSIAWLAHRLSQLHDEQNEKVFDTVVVVTDRTVLDKQLQDAIAQFEKHAGVVQSITRDGGESKSSELASALTGGKQIVIVTIQTFEALITTIQSKPELRGRRFAVIADEAHSSQTGSTAGALTKVLSPQEQAAVAEGAPIDSEAYLQWAMEVTANASNISYFAFTATPKPKTLELFGREPVGGGTPEPFDLYSMQQAIEEGFILDVLQNYTPYKVAWQLQHPGSDYDAPGEVDESTAVKALVRYVRLHPTNISQKAKIVVDHFRQFAQPLLGGKAKAMVVTGSRVEAVRWKKYLDAYLSDSHIQGVKALVAFSGTVEDPTDVGEGLTEKTQNPGLWTSDLAAAFKPSTYNVMIVAEKFQTGFDQPRLVAMYVDRKLGGVQAVQTLSRLNRTYPGKDKTFVLDFVNEPLDILDAFKDYYRKAELTATTDPNLIYDLVTKLDSAGIYTMAEVSQAFDAALAAGVNANSAVSAATAPAVDRFAKRWFNAVTDGDAAEQDELKLFKSDAGQFVKFYDFISQARNLEDTDLPRRHYFFRRILPQLVTATWEEPVDISKVKLSEYSVTPGDAVKLNLEQGKGLEPITAIGSGAIHEKHRSALEEIIGKLNERFGDKYGVGAVDLTVNHIVGKLAVDYDLARQAEVNTPQQFAESPALPKAFAKAVIEVRDETPMLVDDMLSDNGLFAELSKALPAMLYEFLSGKQSKESGVE